MRSAQILHYRLRCLQLILHHGKEHRANYPITIALLPLRDPAWYFFHDRVHLLRRCRSRVFFFLAYIAVPAKVFIPASSAEMMCALPETCGEIEVLVVNFSVWFHSVRCSVPQLCTPYSKSCFWFSPSWGVLFPLSLYGVFFPFLVGFNTVELLGIRNLRYSGIGMKPCDFELS